MVPWCWCCTGVSGTRGVWCYLNELLAADNPISELKVFDLRESMANGGGPACLRLRVVLTEEERRAVNPAVMMNDTLFNALMTGWIVTTAIVLLLPIWPTRNCCAKGGKHWMY
ncbi:N-succinylarginine dihydrolase [Escherichia coli]|nr:N-succinylarginine dihydrolase [Escherichia coli]